MTFLDDLASLRTTAQAETRVPAQLQQQVERQLREAAEADEPCLKIRARRDAPRRLLAAALRDLGLREVLTAALPGPGEFVAATDTVIVVLPDPGV